MNKRILTSILVVLCLSFVVSAAMVVECDKEGSQKTETGTFNEDYLYLGKSLTFSGTTEDLVFLGESLDFNGKAELGLIGAGKDLHITGDIGNGIIAGGKEIVIDGAVEGTNFMGGKNIHILPNATIKGNLFSGSGEFTADGPITGDVYIGAGKIVVNSIIDGDATIYGGRIIITENGKINGNLKYGTKEKLSDAELARVSGQVTFEKHKEFDELASAPKEFWFAIKSIFHLLMILSFVIIGVILLFLPVFKQIEKERTPKTYLRTGLWGLIPMFMYPALIVCSMVMIVTIPFGITLILAAIPLFFVTYVIGTTMAGQYLCMQFNWKTKKRHYHFLIGAVATTILSIIPVIDFFTFIIISSLGWGMVISGLFNQSFDDPEPTVIRSEAQPSVEA